MPEPVQVTISNATTATDPSSTTNHKHSSSIGQADFDVIPPTFPARTLVLCFDGTGDKFDADNSNVVQFFSLLKKDNNREQMVYYQSGIGTYTASTIVSPLVAKVSKTLDVMVAWNLDAHVMEGYKFLMQNYQGGDKICLFGFSRGAYTARALAGMVHKVGLLPAGNSQQVPFAYQMYMRTDETGWKQSTAFKKAFSMDVDIEFVGVWDTVCSVGLIPKRLPFITSNTALHTFRHALSLDERRAKFKANLYNRPTATEARLGTCPGDMPRSSVPAIGQGAEVGVVPGSGHHTGKVRPKDLDTLEHEFDKDDKAALTTNILEVWFAGCHCDVGGGSVANDTPHTLARIPLRWMIRECFKMNTGIRFHAELLSAIGLDPSTLYPMVQPRPSEFMQVHKRSMSDATMVGGGIEEVEEDRADALCPMYDQLQLAPAWWLLEAVPLEQREQLKDDSWVKKLVVNFGHGREVPRDQPFYVHRSVKIRMEAEKLPGGPYRPRAKFTREPIWVD